MLSLVRLSVRYTVDQSKTVEVRIMQFSPYSPIVTLVLVVVGYVHPEILIGSPELGHQTRVGWGNKLSLCIDI